MVKKFKSLNFIFTCCCLVFCTIGTFANVVERVDQESKDTFKLSNTAEVSGSKSYVELHKRGSRKPNGNFFQNSMARIRGPPKNTQYQSTGYNSGGYANTAQNNLNYNGGGSINPAPSNDGNFNGQYFQGTNAFYPDYSVKNGEPRKRPMMLDANGQPIYDSSLVRYAENGKGGYTLQPSKGMSYPPTDNNKNNNFFNPQWVQTMNPGYNNNPNFVPPANNGKFFNPYNSAPPTAWNVPQGPPARPNVPPQNAMAPPPSGNIPVFLNGGHPIPPQNQNKVLNGYNNGLYPSHGFNQDFSSANDPRFAQFPNQNRGLVPNPQYNQPQPQYNQPQPQPQYNQPQPQYNQPQGYAQPPAQPQYNQPQPQYNQPQRQYNQPQPQYNQPQGYAQPPAQPQYNQPQRQYNQPQPQYNQPQGYAQPPAQPQYNQPQPQYNQPQPYYDQPQPQYNQPQPQYDQPQPQYNQPQPQYNQPQPQYDQPQPQYNQPQGYAQPPPQPQPPVNTEIYAQAQLQGNGEILETIGNGFPNELNNGVGAAYVEGNNGQQLMYSE